MADDIHTLSRKVSAMHTELTTTRKLVQRLVEKLDTRDPMEVGARTLPDGRTFLPGTGTLGERALSDEAQAALDALETERPA